MNYLKLCYDGCMFWRNIDCTTNTLVVGTGLELSPKVVLVFSAGALSGDNPHMLQQGDGDHLLLEQNYSCGGERGHVASKAVCFTLSQ